METNLGSIIGHNLMILIPYHPSFHCCLAKNVHFLLFNDSTWFLSLLLSSRWGEIIYCTATIKLKGTYRGCSENQILVLIELISWVFVYIEYILETLEFKNNKWSISVLVRTLSSCLCSCTVLVVIQTPNSII